MKLAVIIAVAALAGVALLLFVRSRTTNRLSVQVRDMPSVVEQLKFKAVNTSWAVFIFTPAGAPENEYNAINLQYSVENGQIGLDWVLAGPKNITEEINFREFVEKNKYKIEKRQMNGVTFLRIEGGDVITLGKNLIVDFYKLDNASKIAVVTDKFTWQPQGIDRS